MVRMLLIVIGLLMVACGRVVSVEVQQDNGEVTVTASGELESKVSLLIAPPSVKQMWQYQIKQLVPENTKVKKGDMLVAFDDKKVSEKLIDKRAELDRAQKELDNKKLKEVETEQELVLNLAEKKMLYEKHKRIANIVDNSKSNIDRRKAEIDHIIAKNDWVLAQEKIEFHKNNSVLNLKLAEGKVSRLTSEVAELTSDKQKLVLTAPMDGMVIYKANWNGEKPSVGENIQFGQPVLELAVIEKMQLKAQIAEPDSGNVSIGQEAKITLDTAQEKVFKGKVISLGQVFRDKSHQDKRRVFDAIIAFDDIDVQLMRPGMTARVEVITSAVVAKQETSAELVKVANHKVTGKSAVKQGEQVAL